METKYINTPEWDKTFTLSDKVSHKKVSFTNRYGIRLVGDLYMPKNHVGKLPTITVCGPYGAVKEQASGLYAQTLAERGFITLAFDPSFCGESGGQPRSVNSNGGWEKIADLPFLTFSLLDHADEIRSAVLVVHGEKAYSLPASQEAFGKLKGDNKELMIIPGASHTDLYDRMDIIPFDKFEAFFKKYL